MTTSTPFTLTSGQRWPLHECLRLFAPPHGGAIGMSMGGGPPRPGITQRTAVYPAVARMLQSGESLVITVTGSCMAPLLRDGQCVTVQKQQRYLPGDILVFAAVDGEFLVHRYLGPAPGSRAMTKADAGARIDVLVPFGQVLGRALTADGAAVAVSAADRAWAALHYIGWLGRLTLGRILTRL